MICTRGIAPLPSHTLAVARDSKPPIEFGYCGVCIHFEVLILSEEGSDGLGRKEGFCSRFTRRLSAG